MHDLLLLRRVFLETSDGVLSSISSMLDSCQKKQIEYLATLREGTEHRKCSPVSAGAGFPRAAAHKFWFPCVSLRCGPGKVECMIRGEEELLCRGDRECMVQPFPWEGSDTGVKWRKGRLELLLTSI